MTVSSNRLDLNLLRVSDAVMEKRSVLRASERVFLSQPAVSHSLARLRELSNDELFIRSPTGMQPTCRPLTMAPLIREARQTASGVSSALETVSSTTSGIEFRSKVVPWFSPSMSDPPQSGQHPLISCSPVRYRHASSRCCWPIPDARITAVRTIVERVSASIETSSASLPRRTNVTGFGAS
jgi:hypothetical protein